MIINHNIPLSAKYLPQCILLPVAVFPVVNTARRLPNHVLVLALIVQIAWVSPACRDLMRGQERGQILTTAAPASSAVVACSSWLRSRDTYFIVLWFFGYCVIVAFHLTIDLRSNLCINTRLSSMYFTFKFSRHRLFYSFR
mmetsp:Transcript_39893/g.94782  ORF Transcript_39893/g.94782 Transcript_39893/m.94782 type:complete len:141 (-) Transcript_39893:995-1417(-)